MPDWFTQNTPDPAMLADQAADRYGVDRNLVRTVAQIESNFNPTAVSPKGALGTMQLMPATARSLGVTNPLDPEQSFDGGAKLLSQLSNKYGGDPRLVMAAYNAGEPAVDRAGGVPNYPETQKYVKKGMRLLGQANDSSQASAAGDWFTQNQPPPAAPEGSPSPISPASLGLRPSQLPDLAAAEPEEKSFGGFMDNVGTSLYNNLISPVIHPAQTLAGISNLLEGMSEKSGNAPLPGFHGQQAVDALVNLYTQRYGSWQGFKDAWYNDPVGMASDLANVVSAGGIGVSAAQDFLKASGLSEAAMEAQNALAKGVSSAAVRVPPGVRPEASAGGWENVARAFTQGAAGAVPGAAKSAVDKAIELALGGPHAMLLGGKAAFLKEVLKGGFGRAREALSGGEAAPEAAAASAASGAPYTGTYTYGQSPFQLPNLGTYDFRQGYTPPFTEAPPRPPMTAKPWESPYYSPAPETAPAAPEPPAPTPEELTLKKAIADRFGIKKSPDKWDDREQALIQLWYDRATKGLPEEAPPAQAPPVTPQELTQDITGKPPSKQSAAAQTSAAETLTTAQAPAPEAAPVAPVAPAEAPATAPVSRAQQAAQMMTDLEAMTRPERMTDFVRRIAADIAPADLDKFSPDEWKMIARGAGSPEGTVPTPQDIEQIRANLAQAPAGTSGGGPAGAEPAPVMPPATRQPAPPKPADVAEMPPAEALAALFPEFRTPPPETGVTALTASAARVEALAQELAKGTIPTSELARIERTPNAMLLLETLSRRLVGTRPAPGEIPRIVERVRQLRGEPPATKAAAAAKP